MRRFSDEELKLIRNHITVQQVLSILGIPCKEVEGEEKFLCPNCQEFRTGINPRVNLTRCFRCERNFNTIELVMAERKMGFVDSVKLLKNLFAGFETMSPK